MNRQNRRIKAACYTINVGMSIVSNITPLLFLTFRESYGLSYSSLGFLVLINFFVQLSVDVFFSLFPNRINPARALKLTPFICATGFVLFSAAPWLFPDSVYAGLLIGTVIFSASGGLCEVLISPCIAALPSEHPDREMSRLHSVYAWGVVFVVVLCSPFLVLVGRQYWQYMMLALTAVPLTAAFLFSTVHLPLLSGKKPTFGEKSQRKSRTFFIFFVTIFLGSASESVIAQWSSGYLEQTLTLPKIWGDILGVAGFALLLGLGRSLYAKFGRQIEPVMLFGAVGAFVCYLVLTLFNVTWLAVCACALAGFFISMLWPGSLVVMTEHHPEAGVTMFAMMAAGGDLGGSIAPQLVGIITDAMIANESMVRFGEKLGLSAEQTGMKCGLLFSAIFPAVLIFFCISLYRKRIKSPSLIPEIK